MNSARIDSVDLFEVVDSLARLLGGPIAVEDLDFRVLAYSAIAGQSDDEARRAAILNRRTPERWLRWMNETGLRETLRNADEPIRLDLPWVTETARFIYAVKHRDHVVGYIWIMLDREQLSEEAVQVVGEFAQLISGSLAARSLRTPEDAGGRSLGQFLAGALTSGQLAELLEVDEAGIESVVIAVQTLERPSTSSTTAFIGWSDARRDLALYAQLQLPKALVTTIDDSLIVLVVAPQIQDRMLNAALDGILNQLGNAIGKGILVASGDVHPGVSHIAQSLEEAEQTLSVLKARGVARTSARYDSMRYDIVLHAALDGVHSLQRVPDQLVDQFGGSGSVKAEEQLHTLRCYLDLFGDVRAAARILQVHPNTLRYRLRRFAESANIDLNEPEVRLALELVLRASRHG